MATNTHRQGFTLIELMVALAVTGILMAGLVSISGTMQRAIARNKEVTELQSNLRFAMRVITEDISRAAFMASPNPKYDNRYYEDARIDLPAISFIESASSDEGPQIRLRGNFDTSKDFCLVLTSSTTGQIACRDCRPYDKNTNCGYDASQPVADRSDPYLLPFGPVDIQPGETDIGDKQSAYNQKVFKTVFFKDQLLRMFRSINHYLVRKVVSVNPSTMTIVFDDIDRDANAGHNFTINPISAVAGGAGGVSILEVRDTDYTPDFTTSNAQKWDLIRRKLGSDGVMQSFKLAEFLLPPTNGGFELAAYNDTQVPNLLSLDKTGAWVPSIDHTSLPPTVTATNQLDPFATRAVVVTLRARTENEDPDFYIEAGTGSQNFALDLDGEPENGMAHVRVERTVIELKNTIPSMF